MMFVKWWFLLLAIPAIEGSLRFWKPEGFSFEERVTKKILETCYGDNDFKDLILILGDFDEFMDKASIIRMNDLPDIVEDYVGLSFSSIRVTKILIIQDSPEKLYLDLISFNKTKWWNHMLPFFIIGKNDEKCENFKEIVNTTSQMGILNSIYICSESENTTLYTLNPFTDYAPDPWKRMEDLNDSNIYHQVFDPHTSCNNLNYDKAKVLNGFLIEATREVYITEFDGSMPSPDAYNEFPDSRLFNVVMRQMNASLFYRMNIFYFVTSKNVVMCSAKLAHLNLGWMETRKASLSFCIRATIREVILVKFHERTVLYKIGHLWNIEVLCGAAVSLIILFLILVRKNGGITSAMLDMIRFFTYLSIRTDMRGNSFRIYFTTMLIFIVISNGVFQGKIAAFLTTLDKVPPIKTVEELLDAGYHFYAVHWWSEYLLPERAFSRMTVIDDDTCINYALNGELNACIMPLSLYEEKYRLKSLQYVEPPSYVNDQCTWISRPNWPLSERFNYMLMRFVQSGIYTKWQDEEFYRMKDKIKADDHELALAEIVPPYRPIELVKLDFAFKLLAIGLSFAIFVLIIELRMREI